MVGREGCDEAAGAVPPLTVGVLVDRGADRIVIASAWAIHHLEETPRPGPPTVLVDCPRGVPGYLTIGPESERATAAAVRHLVDVHGHATVALVLGESGPMPENRERGWAGALRAAGRPLGVLERAPFSYEGGYAAGLRLATSPERPTAVVASSDLQAFGLLLALHEQGLQVPEDVAVISFDGTRGTQFTWPPLTVVQQPVQAMAEAAVKAAVGSDGVEVSHQAFPMDLVVRDSCGCRPQARGDGQGAR